MCVYTKIYIHIYTNKESVLKVRNNPIMSPIYIHISICKDLYTYINKETKSIIRT
jgi:hypothetical protein